MMKENRELLLDMGNMTVSPDAGTMRIDNSILTEDERKKMRRSALIKMLAIIGVAAAVIVFSSLSWFSMNQENAASGMGVRVEAGNYELRFSGNNIGALSYTAGTPVNGVTPYTSTDIYGKVTPASDYAHNLVDGSKTNIFGTDYYDTDGSHSEVILRLDNDYLDPDKEKGLNPGSEGVIRFWVVPKKSGTLTAKFSLNIAGYTAVQSDSAPFDVTSVSPIPESLTPLGDSPTDAEREAYETTAAQIQAVNYLRAHILFFKGENANNEWTYTDFMNDDLEDDLYAFTFENAVEGEPIEVRIRWVWTNTFKQMVLPSSDNNAPAVTNDNTVRRTIQNYAYEHYDDIFKSIELSTVQSKMMKYQLKSGSETEYEYVFDAETLNTGTNLDDLSRGYNRADSEVGKRVRYMLLVLGAE